MTCSTSDILEFLQEYLDSGKSPTRGFFAAISAARGSRLSLSPDGRLISQFLKGAQRLKARRSESVPPWDLDTVLRALVLTPFEPLESVDLKWLSMKTAFLIAITSAKRISELHTLSVYADCCRFLPDDGGVILRPNPAFLPKVLSPLHLNQVTELHSFQGVNQDEGTSSLLCPVRTL